MADHSELGIRETLLEAVFRALQRIPNVELCERNRDDDIDKGVATAILMYDGDLIGETDLPYSASRKPIYPMHLTVELFGVVQGGSGNVGTRINKLWSDAIRALHTDPEFLTALAQNGAGIRVTSGRFPVVRSPGAKSSGAFLVDIEIPFEFDPTDP